MSFGYLEKSKIGLPRSGKFQNSSEMIRISRGKSNNCHSTIEKIESSIDIIIHLPTRVGKKIKPLMTETIVKIEQKKSHSGDKTENQIG